MKNKHFRKLSPKQVFKFSLKFSHNKRSRYHKLMQSINKTGKQVFDTDRQGFSKLGSPSLIQISFQKWLLQKLPKHPPNNLHSSSTIRKPLFTRSFTFSFKLCWLPPAPHLAEKQLGSLFLSVFSNPNLENWCEKINFMEKPSGYS